MPEQVEIQHTRVQDAEESGNDALTRQAFVMTIIATSLGFVLVQMDVSIVNVALAQIGNDLRINVAGLQWVVDAYALVFAVLLLFAGALADRIGARRAFIAGFSVFVLASLLCGLAPNAALLIAARAVQGLGAALLVPCSLALLNHACRGDAVRRAQAIGIWSASGSAALAVGPVLGGLLVHAIGWRSIFFVNLPLGLIGIWLTLRFAEETSAHKDGRFDIVGQVLAIVSLASLTATIIEAGTVGWLAPLILCGFAFALASGAAFVLVEARVRTPMLPLDFFRNTTFSAATLVGLAVNLTLYGIIFVFSLYLQQVRHFSALAFSIAFLPLPLGLLMANLVVSWLGGRIGARLLMVVGLLVAAVGYWLLHGLAADTPYMLMLPGLLVIPLGLGFTVPTMTNALLSTVPRARSGIASGVLNTVRQAGGAIGVAIFGAFIARDAVAGVDTVFIVSAVVVLAAAVIALFGVRRRISSREMQTR